MHLPGADKFKPNDHPKKYETDPKVTPSGNIDHPGETGINQSTDTSASNENTDKPKDQHISFKSVPATSTVSDFSITQDEQQSSASSDSSESNETNENPLPLNEPPTGNDGDLPESEGNRVTKSGNNIADVPSDIPDGKDDKMGYHHISDAIYSLIDNKEIKPPFNIGITGQYGMGKSKILEQVIKRLEDNNPKINSNKIEIKEKRKTFKKLVNGLKKIKNFKKTKRAKKERYDIIKTVFLNIDKTHKYVKIDAGRYHESNLIWSAIIIELFAKFDKEKTIWGPFKYGQIKYAFTNNMIISSFNLILIFGALLITAIYGIFKLLSIDKKIEIIVFLSTFTVDNYKSILTIIGFILLINTIRKIWSNPLVKKSISYFGSYPATPDIIKDRIELEKRTATLFKAWLKQENKKKNIENEKIVLVIDNLDRCNPDKVIDIIDEIFALMSHNDISKHLICLIAVDERSLLNALKRQNRNLQDQIDYFEKLFSLKINLPEMDFYSIIKFLEETINFNNEERFGEYDIDKRSTITNDTSLTIDEKKLIHSTLATKIMEMKKQDSNDHLKLTPRKVNRIVFAYRFIKFLWARLDPTDNSFNDDKIIRKLCKDKGDNDIVETTIDKYIDMVQVNYEIAGIENPDY